MAWPRCDAGLTQAILAQRAGRPFDQALLYLGLGDHPRALDWFERAYAADAQSLVWLKVDKIYDPLRTEPRFIALLRKLNFMN